VRRHEHKPAESQLPQHSRRGPKNPKNHRDPGRHADYQEQAVIPAIVRDLSRRATPRLAARAQCLSPSMVTGDTGTMLILGPKGTTDCLSNDVAVVGLSGSSMGSLGIDAGSTSGGGDTTVPVWRPLGRKLDTTFLSLRLMYSPTRIAPTIRAIRPPTCTISLRTHTCIMLTTLQAQKRHRAHIPTLPATTPAIVPAEVGDGTSDTEDDSVLVPYSLVVGAQLPAEAVTLDDMACIIVS
jgi:hypothetical protein